jgi:Na+-translocating ferredoxin:NAD+ oxidoreductase RnfG subunit
LFLFSFSFGRTSRESAEALLKNSFGENVRISSASVILSSTEKDSMKTLTGAQQLRDTLHLLVASNEGTLGYAIVDDARGKDQPITYCLVVDERLVVKDVEILAYREPYGGEVQNKSWLRQFFDKTPSDQMRPAREIRNITGATISSRAMTLGVKKLLTLLTIVKARLPHSGGAIK